ncbi:MAG: HAD family hydrolase [Leptolyngbya sp. SIO4C1]|nr:HAD family hydrolase [Leptolyngbya sp. SIO4C1]
MSHLAALIFDVDGTLAETERDGHRVAFNRAFEAAGLDWYWSIGHYGRLLDISGGKERIRHFIETEHPDLQTPAGFDSRWQFIQALHQSKTEFYKREIASISLCPGIKRLLNEARAAGLRLAIATTSTFENVLPLLENQLGLDSPDWFEVIAAGDSVPHKKPAPDIYHYVLKRLSLPPSACLAFEDTHHGLIAATQAGIKTVITVNSYTAQQDFAKAAAVLSHLGDPNQPIQVIKGKIEAYYVSVAVAKQIWAQSPAP